MNGDRWMCDGCDTVNLVGQPTCRTCLRTAGSTTDTTVLTAPDAGARPRRVDEAEPEFQVHSKYEATQRPSRVKFSGANSGNAARPQFPPPPPPPPMPPPPPPPLPARPPAAVPRPTPGPARGAAPSGKFGPVVLVSVVIAAVVGVLIAAIGNGGGEGSGDGVDNGTTPRSTPTAVAVPCPPAVARWLPGGGAGTELVAAYQTSTHLITLCRTPGGQAHYDGQEKGKPANDQFHISLPAQQTASGYVSHNNGYTYEVGGGVLVVSGGPEGPVTKRLEPAP